MHAAVAFSYGAGRGVNEGFMPDLHNRTTPYEFSQPLPQLRVIGSRPWRFGLFSRGMFVRLGRRGVD